MKKCEQCKNKIVLCSYCGLTTNRCWDCVELFAEAEICDECLEFEQRVTKERINMLKAKKSPRLADDYYK